MKRTARILLAVAVFAGVVVGCKSLAPGEDPILVNAEKVEESGFYLTDAFVKLDRANPALESALPGVHAAAQSVRQKAPDAIRQLRGLINTYRNGPGAKPDLSTAVTLVKQLMDDAQVWINRAAGAGVAEAQRVLSDRRAKQTRSSLPFPETGAGFFVLAATAKKKTAKKKTAKKITKRAPTAKTGGINFSWLTSVLAVIDSGGINVGADVAVLTELYQFLKSTFARDRKMTPEQRATLEAAEEAAFAGAEWDPRNP